METEKVIRILSLFLVVAAFAVKVATHLMFPQSRPADRHRTDSLPDEHLAPARRKERKTKQIKPTKKLLVIAAMAAAAVACTSNHNQLK